MSIEPKKPEAAQEGLLHWPTFKAYFNAGLGQACGAAVVIGGVTAIKAATCYERTILGASAGAAVAGPAGAFVCGTLAASTTLFV